jgi:hypothetical protein
MKARFTKWGPAADYRGAHVLDRHGRLATIVGVYHHEVLSVTMARLQRFNGDDAGEQPLSTLDILERTP